MVKRFFIGIRNNAFTAQEERDGAWVHWDDYDALSAERDELRIFKELAESAIQAWRGLYDEAKEQVAERDEILRRLLDMFWSDGRGMEWSYVEGVTIGDQDPTLQVAIDKWLSTRAEPQP